MATAKLKGDEHVGKTYLAAVYNPPGDYDLLTTDVYFYDDARELVRTLREDDGDKYKESLEKMDIYEVQILRKVEVVIPEPEPELKEV